MWLFKKKDSVKKRNSIPKNVVRIQVGRESINIGNNVIPSYASIINANEEWSLRDFINIILENCCPKIQEKSVLWILSYQNRSLAVLDSGNGHVNILNDKFVELTIKDIVGSDSKPQMILYYINPSDIEESFKTIIQKSI